MCVFHAVAEADFFVVEKRIVDPHSDTILYNNIAHSLLYMSHCTCMCLYYKGHPYFGLDGARWFVSCEDGGVAANSSLRFVSFHTVCCVIFLSLLLHFLTLVCVL